MFGTGVANLVNQAQVLGGGEVAEHTGDNVASFSFSVIPVGGKPNSSGIVYDSVTRASVAGVSVRLVDPSASPLPPLGSIAPHYYTRIYFGGSPIEAINNHIPIDPVGTVAGFGLLVAKAANKKQVEMGEFVDYSVRVQNSSPLAFPATLLVDSLPHGFSYVSGSARLSGAAMPEPQHDAASSILNFELGNLPPASTLTLSYRAQVGVKAMQGDGTNSAQAISGSTRSNVAKAGVKLIGGAFPDESYLLGTVFADGNGGGLKGADEPGVPDVSPQIDAPFPASSPVPLEKLLPELDNSLGFVDLGNGDVLPMRQTHVRVKGAADAFGNLRGSQEIRLVAPAGLGRLHLDLPAERVADGRTPLKIVVRLTDMHDVPVTSRTLVTLESTLGVWQVVDLNPDEPGIQVFIEGGRAEFDLLPPLSPAVEELRVSSGTLRTRAYFKYTPELRPMIAAGVIEGAFNLHNLDLKKLVPVRERDSLEL